MPSKSDALRVNFIQKQKREREKIRMSELKTLLVVGWWRNTCVLNSEAPAQKSSQAPNGIKNRYCQTWDKAHARRFPQPPDRSTSCGIISIMAANISYSEYNPQNEETQLPGIRDLISKDLSEPYSIYVFRYFIYRNPELCLMVSPTRF